MPKLPWRSHMHGVFRAEVGDNHLGRCNITSHLSVHGQLRAAARALHILGILTHKTPSLVSRAHRSGRRRTTLCHCEHGTREQRDERHALCSPMHWRQCARGPGAQQLTGGAPLRPRAQPLRAPPPPPRPSPLSNPLFTDGRPVSGAFVLAAAPHRFTIVQI